MTTSSKHTFPTTQWSLVLAVGATDPERAAVALEKLCRRYWPPVYAFLRQRGQDQHQAEDLTQGFFAGLLARRGLLHANQERGRFRAFLLGSLKHHLCNERDREQTIKRGGGQVLLFWDAQLAEEGFQQLASEQDSPERHFERQWAAVLIQRAIGQLQQDYATRGLAALAAGLQPWLTAEPDTAASERLARDHDLTIGALRVALHRARRRFGELLRQEVAHTVQSPDEVEAELRHLLAVIAE